MHIGILLTERHDINVENRYGSYSDMFQRLFHQVDSYITFTTYRVIDNKYPEALNDCDAYVITGSKESVYDDLPWINTVRKFIVNAVRHNTKLVGICFGHQLIADTLGGKVEKHADGWGVGVMKSTVTESNSWMHPALDDFSLLVSHQDQVVELPDGATRIAENNFCVNSAFRIGRKVLCFQGHPEFEVDYLEERLTLRRERIGEGRYFDAIQTLNLKTQHVDIAHWIVNFMQETN